MTGHVSAAAWLVADIHLIITITGYTVTGIWLRRRLMPQLVGSAAALASAIGAVFAAVVEGEALGLVAQFSRAPLAALALVVATGLLVSTRGMPAAAPRVAPHAGALDLAGLAVGLVLALAHWAGPLRLVLTTGFKATDSLSYHLPYAVNFVQRHAIRGYVYASPDATSTFQPLNAELLDAELSASVHRDILIPLTNLPWTGLALLSGWVTGRATGRPGRAGLGAALVGGLVGLPLLSREAGEPLNDIAGLALTLAAVALLVSAGRSFGAVAAGSAAAGLALGTKASELGVAGLLLLACLAAACRYRRGTARVRVVAVGMLSAFLGGGLWYVRNALLAGNPIAPAQIPGLPSTDIGHFGPIDYSVAHYLGHGGVFPAALIRTIGPQWGPLWAFIGALATVVVVVTIATPSCLTARVLGTISLIAFAVYLVTPSGALGPPTGTNVFVYNLRYVIPALGVGLLAALQACPERFSGRLVQVLLVGAAGVVASDDLLPNAARDARTGSMVVAGGFVLAALILAASVIVGARSRRMARMTLGAVAGVVLLFAADLAGEHMAPHDESSYATIADVLPALDRLAPRVVVVAAPNNIYLAQGRSFERQLYSLGVPIAHGGFRAVASCSELHSQLVRLHADALYVYRGVLGTSPQIQTWAAQDQHDVIATSPDAIVYRVNLTAPSTCP
jgi:hypothetical protein